MIRWFIGFDVGQSVDYSAMVFVEQRKVSEQDLIRLDPHDPRMIEDQLVLINVYDVRHIERPPRGMSYVDQVKILKSRMVAPEITGSSVILVDQTGCGRPVIDMMRGSGVDGIVPITITGGNSVTYGPDGFCVPKKELVAALQLFFQSGRIKIAASLPEAQMLKNEVLNFKVKVNPKTGSEAYEAWREGDHDDIVLALAMACWYAQRFDYKERLTNDKAVDWDPLRWGLEET
jgi:hypothetical protein